MATMPYFLSGRPRPQYLILITLVISVSLLSFFYYSSYVGSDLLLLSVRDSPRPEKLPPLYEHIVDETALLPQHSPEIPEAEQDQRRFFMIENQIWGVGFNNVLEEILLNCHLAYLSNRSYVFQQFTWSLEPGKYSQKHGHLSASAIPLRAFIHGPVAGGPWPEGDPAPRSISREYWEKTCPPEKRTVLNGTAEAEAMGFVKQVTPTQVVLEKWMEKLSKMTDRCVVLHPWTNRIFDLDEIGGAVIHSIWPKYQHAPVLQNFEWSPIVMSGVNKNLHLLTLPDNPPKEGNTTIPGLLALHVRRGDYIEHCKNMALGSAPFWGMNRLPPFPDRFNPPVYPSPEKDTRENVDKHHDHCYPSLAQIVHRVELISRDYPVGAIKRIYILTNAKFEELYILKNALRDSGFPDVVTSRDLELDWEEKGMDGMIDMEFAIRAEMFLGNGFSSLTTNVNILRLARGMSYQYSRFY